MDRTSFVHPSGYVIVVLLDVKMNLVRLRWLDRAVKRGFFNCQGAGRKSDPFHYWLPERGRREW